MFEAAEYGWKGQAVGSGPRDIANGDGGTRLAAREFGRIGVVGMSKEEGRGVVFHLYEWTHKHFPNFVDCRPIFIARALEEAGFRVQKQEHRSIWVPVEVALATKDAAG